MQIIIASISVFLITILVWLVKRSMASRPPSGAVSWICPVCLGVLMTWLGFLVVHYYFQSIDLFVPAIMMGGSVVGFAYYLEKKLDKKRFMNLWKTIFIVIGFLAVYYLLKEAWSRFLVADILELTSIVMIIKSGKEGESVTKDEATNRAAASRKQLEDCC